MLLIHTFCNFLDTFTRQNYSWAFWTIASSIQIQIEMKKYQIAIDYILLKVFMQCQKPLIQLTKDFSGVSCL